MINRLIDFLAVITRVITKVITGVVTRVITKVIPLLLPAGRNNIFARGGTDIMAAQ
jgi:hypothetical protein